MVHVHEYFYDNDYAEGYIWQDEDILEAFNQELQEKSQTENKKTKHAGGSSMAKQSSILDRKDIFEQETYSTVDLELIATVSILCWLFFTCVIYQYKAKQARYCNRKIVKAVNKKPRIFILNETEDDLFDFPLNTRTVLHKPFGMEQYEDFEEKHVFEPLIG